MKLDNETILNIAEKASEYEDGEIGLTGTIEMYLSDVGFSSDDAFELSHEISDQYIKNYL